MTFAWRHYSRLLTLATAAAETEHTRGNSALRSSGGTGGGAPRYSGGIGGVAPRYSGGTGDVAPWYSGGTEGGAPRYSEGTGGVAPRYSGGTGGGAPWYSIDALSRYARARHEVGTRFLQHETMRVSPASPARHGSVCSYPAHYYDVISTGEMANTIWNQSSHPICMMTPPEHLLLRR